MPEKERKPAFTVSDRRKFTAEGEPRPEVEPTEEEQGERPAPTRKPEAPRPASTAPPPPATPPQPTSAEHQAQERAYKASTTKFDEDLKSSLGTSAPRQFEATFRGFVTNLYMNAMVDLGLAHEQGGEPRVDILAARHTIDTVALLQEKTKGNLTPEEESLLRNVLYELRMAYVEVTNLLAKPPQPGQPGPERR